MSRGTYLHTTALTLVLVASGTIPGALAQNEVRLPTLSVQDTGAGNKVSSPKFTAPLIDTPQTVTVIPQAIFTQQGARDLTEVLRNTPGITFNAGENGFTSGVANFSMRGFDATSSIFIDGVRDSGNYSRDIFNMDRVEVVKGPAADNGRGSGGGYVNLVTKTPHMEPVYSGTASVGLDEYDSKERGRVTVDVNQPITENTAIRLNGLWEDGGVAGRSIAEKKSVGFAPSMTIGLNSPTRFTVSYSYTQQDNLPEWGVPAALMSGMLRYDPTLDGDALRDNFYGLASDFDDVEAHAVLARVEHDFASGLRISNQTRWSKTERDATYTIPGAYTAATKTLATDRQAYRRDNDSISNQTNLSGTFSTGSIGHSFSAGIEFSHEKSIAGRFPGQANPGTGAPISIFDPNPNRAAAIVLAPTQLAEVRVKTFSGYAYDTIQFSPAWQLTGGVRVEHYNVKLQSSTAAGAAQGPNGYDESRTTVGGKVGLVYKPAENGSIYAAVGFSALPPASYLSNPDISREGDNAFPGFSVGLNSANAKVQRFVNYEIGAKWNFFDNRLATTAAFFRTERKNVAISGRDTRLTPVPTAVTLLGYGKQVVQGAEFSVSGQITPAWNVFGGLLIQDSERKHSAFLDAGRRLANAADYGTALRTSGDELAFTPKVSANLWTTYDLPFDLTIGGGIEYKGSSWVGRPDDAERIIANGVAGKLPSYVVFNAMVEYDVTKNILLRLNVDNVGDKRYAVSTNWNAQRVVLGAPRSFLLSTHVQF